MATACELLGRARDTLGRKYGVELTQSTVVEIFPEQKDFAVRTFGMPGNPGYLGVCFGLGHHCEQSRVASAESRELGGRSLARILSRHYAYGYPQPHAALAERRYFRLRRTAGKPVVGREI